MALILLVVLSFPIGYLVRNRMAAFLAYLAAFNFVFTFQSIYLITKWVGGSQNAFGTYPKATQADVYSYGVVNLLFLCAGVGLLTLGRYVAERRRARGVQAVPVSQAI
jgi:hypothetical protein